MRVDPKIYVVQSNLEIRQEVDRILRNNSLPPPQRIYPPLDILRPSSRSLPELSSQVVSSIGDAQRAHIRAEILSQEAWAEYRV
jgi:hypothetical protein